MKKKRIETLIIINPNEHMIKQNKNWTASPCLPPGPIKKTPPHPLE
jgi:hypothetical protein